MSGSSRLSALGLAAVGVLISCEPQQDPVAVTDFTVVEAVMQIGPSDLVFKIRGNDPVTTATPTVASIRVTSSAGDTAGGFHQQNSPPEAWLVPVGNNFTAPGRSYALRVLMSNGRVITGTTTMPNSARPPLDTLSLRMTDTLRLSWPRVSGAAGYQVFVNGMDQYGQETYYSVFTDTSVVLPLSRRNLNDELLFVPTRSAYVTVAAVDQNYLDYYRPTVDPLAGIRPTHLSGGIGVFGSVVNIVRKQIAVQR